MREQRVNWALGRIKELEKEQAKFDAMPRKTQVGEVDWVDLVVYGIGQQLELLRELAGEE
jgi:hypothetical protein